MGFSMDEAAIFKTFVERFAVSPLQDRATEEAFSIVEATFQLRFPRSYRTFMLTYGAVGLKLLTTLQPDEETYILQDFVPVSNLDPFNRSYWEGGMPTDVVAFALDGMGNTFCFERQHMLQDDQERSGVVVFDHDFGQIHRVADSFSSWLEQCLSFLAVEPLEDPVEHVDLRPHRLVLLDPGARRVEVLALVRKITQLPLREAQQLVGKPGAAIVEDFSRTIEKWSAEFKALGAAVTIEILGDEVI